MRIQCNNIPDFLRNLDGQDPRFSVRIAAYWEPCPNCPSTRVEIVACALIEGDETILVTGREVCGFDYPHEGQKYGSHRMSRLRHEIEIYCREHGLEVMPGILEKD